MSDTKQPQYEVTGHDAEKGWVQDFDEISGITFWYTEDFYQKLINHPKVIQVYKERNHDKTT